MDELWYKNAVIYAVDVETFADANGDGIGDFQGLTDRLGYLADLGVTCLWLLPFYPSPNRDNGYDIEDYYGVADRYGTLDDFRTFLHRAKEHGIRVITDLIVNHTSDQHPWFQAARADMNSEYRNYYVWTDSPEPVPPDGGNIFPGQENTVWTFDEVAGAYYYHRFYSHEPELQTAEPAVQREIEKIMDFWLSFGISGFRIDAVAHLIDQKGLESTRLVDPRGVLKDFRHFVTQRNPQSVLIGEADVDADKLPGFFAKGEGLNMLFNFLLAQYLFHALAQENGDSVVRVMNLLPTVSQDVQWANFLRNLDELDMERLTEEERAEIFEAFAPEEEMQIFGRGTRRRLAPMLGNDRQRIRLALSLLFSMPGSPLLVYGDEIGMGEDLSLHGRSAVRTPMQWSGEKNGGFSSADSSELAHPVISEGEFGYQNVNVAEQRDDPESLLNWMRRLIRVRRQCTEIGWGTWHEIKTEPAQILAHRCEWRGATTVFVHNLGGTACDATLDLRDYNVKGLLPLIGGAEQKLLEEEIYHVQLPAYGNQWYRIDHKPE